MRLVALSLLLLAGSAFGQERLDARAVDAAIDRGVAFLRAKGEEDGGRHLDSKNERTGLRALVLYTMVKGGTRPDDPLVLSVLQGLAQDTELQNYDRACLLMLLATLDPDGHRAWIERLAQDLVDVQEESGAWSYPGLVIDLSNTQYAGLGLWAASKAGVEVAPEVWRSLATGTFDYQSDDGGFSYTAPPGGSTGSMTTAGVGTLALCEQQLALAGALDDAFAADLAVRRERAVAWLDENFAVDTNPALGGHHYYYLYGLERMAAFGGLARIGEHDWYTEGAAWLLDHQDEEGSWAHGSDLAQTCFAVLFLERATNPVRRRAPSSGPKRDREAKTTEADAAVRVAVEVEHGVARARIAGWSPSAMRPYLWPGEEAQGPRVRRVEYRIADRILGVAVGAPERPAGTDALPAVLRRSPEGVAGGLVARVHLARPPGTASDLAEHVDSPPLEVALPAGGATVALARGACLTPERAKTKTSSYLRRSKQHPDGDYEGERAVDGNPATPWLTKPGDDEPSLRVSPRKPLAAAGVYVSPPTLPGSSAAPVGRPTEVEVVLNGKSRTATRHALGAVGRTYIAFAEPVRVKSVEVRIVAVDSPPADEVEDKKGAPTGLGEVSLRPAN